MFWQQWHSGLMIFFHFGSSGTVTTVAFLIRELKQVRFLSLLTTRTSAGSKVDVFHQSQPLTQSSDVTHAVRVVKNVTCLSSLVTIEDQCKHNGFV
jgi:3-deoxy-D-manno-octulosonic-acid transferase